jgi:type II secretory pathway component PulK
MIAGTHSKDGRRLPAGAAESGSTLIIVLWIAFGLVSLALYFANSMTFELRASDNRVSAQSADEAIDGAARYISSTLSYKATNGVLPGITTYSNAAVPVSESHFWLIGRDTNNPVGPGKLCFGLVDEASKLNLNRATSNQIVWLPRMTTDLTTAILDWRSTNGPGTTEMYYETLQPAYECKSAPFESVDELRLLYGASMDILAGEDANRNGVLDPNENDENQNGALDAGVWEYVTVYTREPNPATNSSGTARVNITTLTSNSKSGSCSNLNTLLQSSFGQSRATQILTQLGITSTNNPPTPLNPPIVSPLQFYRRSKMTSTEFAQIANNIMTTTNSYIRGRVNVNTASAPVLAALLGGDTSAGQLLVNYRQSNAGNLNSIAWVVDALGQNYSSYASLLEAGDYLTTQSYQFAADVAALGPHGRGYRRVKFIFDTSSGTPQIIYRQDLSQLGWALGNDVRQKWLAAKDTR